MLVLSRKVGEKIVIGDNITIVVNRISGNRVSIGVEAPEDLNIVRGELELVRRSFASDADTTEATLASDAACELVPETFLSAS